MISLYSTKSKFIEVLFSDRSSLKYPTRFVNSSIIMIGKNEIDTQY